ncbi:MAG TPA: DNA gyrase subunit A [Phycisphaerales bacterium]|nr:DNA gyrase subunit A [Phycisphaerales bacterium]HMP37912.1 DNA gyrase subunit A [Phycisphaerales bacterium]
MSETTNPHDSDAGPAPRPAAQPADDASRPPVSGAPAADAPGDRPAYGLVVEHDIERELHDSYLTYAMSTIMDRALPDVRDGLKPSQRRILVAMHDLNLSPGRKHIKCAKICGDTSGNYHPHGEGVIYPTLVNLGQDWKTRCLLIDKQGNFGSIEGDPPAAMRYTEARMTHAATAMLEDIRAETVDFKPNYDDRLMEPVVLPARFPNLLVNGSSGIAVGMTSLIPPHNLAEVCRAIIATIDDPEIGVDRLMQVLPGPDFPTGGIIMGRRGIAEAYATGRGRLVVRGRVRHERQGQRDVIIIEQIPYQVSQSQLIEEIVDASRGDRIPDISDVRNHSGRDARTRILVVLKKGADPAVVERQLYEFTRLQSSFSVANVALVNRQPRTLTLRQMIQCWIDHRIEVIRRRTEFQLRQAKQQAHRLEGLILAVCDIDEVIAVIRSSRTREEAIQRLQRRAFRIAPEHPLAPSVPAPLLEPSRRGDGIALTRVQAEAIGALRLIQLTGLEIERLAEEYARLLVQIEGFERILADQALVLDIIRRDCEELAERLSDPRRTTIEESDADDFELGELVPVHTVVVTVSHRGYIKRLPADTYREQGRGGRGIKAGETRDEDFIEHLLVSSSHDDLLCFTNTGRVFRIKVWQIPEQGRTASGRAIVNLLDLREGESICAFLTIPDFERSEDYLFFSTAQGRVKRSALKDYRNVHRAGIIAVNLVDGDRLIDVVRTGGEDHVLLATAEGMAIRFPEEDVRVMGRSAAGVRGVDLRDGDEVVGLVRCAADPTAENPDLLTVTANGYGKRTELVEYLVQGEDGSIRPQGRGGKGRIDIRTTERNGRVVAVRSVRDGDGVMIATERGMLVRIAASSISRIGRNTQGVRLVDVREGDEVVGVATVPDQEADADAPDEVAGTAGAADNRDGDPPSAAPA